MTNNFSVCCNIVIYAATGFKLVIAFGDIDRAKGILDQHRVALCDCARDGLVHSDIVQFEELDVTWAYRPSDAPFIQLLPVDAQMQHVVYEVAAQLNAQRAQQEAQRAWARTPGNGTPTPANR